MKRHRILCLHGAHSNNDITEFQLLGLKLSQRCQCESIHAPHVVSSSSAGLNLFSDGPWYSWASESLAEPTSKQWDESLEYLANFLKQNGPFDGVYGFSQGAAMITNFSHPSIWRDRFKFQRCPWKFAILACGGGSANVTLGDNIMTTIQTPSFHISGANDPIQAESHALEKYWEGGHKTTYTHQRGHEIDMLLLTREKELASLLDEFLEKQG